VSSLTMFVVEGTSSQTCTRWGTPVRVTGVGKGKLSSSGGGGGPGGESGEVTRKRAREGGKR